ncbi:MAG TPA: HAMP domain-containing sensor histidine kinase [Streptosporangiaceae bacterium]|nr:HAMP domain-containing sensor histidine kinase [Streptosporangiaceae bacterium]
MRGKQILHKARVAWVDITWVVFIILNLLAMRLIPAWQTVPFLIIWVTLTAAYGFRLWRVGSTILTVSVVTLATGGLIGYQVLRGKQDADYLAEVPLLAILFVVMVWHSRRRMAALEEMRRVSEHNLRLLAQQRQFLQDASHELGTPLTIALGHAELIKNATADHAIEKDARVAVEQLLRMRRLTSRMLLLAAMEGPDFVHLAPVNVEEVLVETLDRWHHVPRRWSVSALVEAQVEADGDRLSLALDALMENAVHYTDTGDQIDVSARRDGDTIILAVRDSGPGIPATEVDRIFGRFARVDAGGRKTDGFGLGLPIVKAIAEAHQGSVQVSSAVGRGSVFELRLPVADSAVGARRQLTPRAV